MTMVVSCLLAVLVNISQFMCLGRFSAVSFQVGGRWVAGRVGGWVGCCGGWSVPQSLPCAARRILFNLHPGLAALLRWPPRMLTPASLPLRPPPHPDRLQVLGHSKTILVLLGGWAFLGDTITAKKFAGMMLAVSGMVW